MFPTERTDITESVGNTIGSDAECMGAGRVVEREGEDMFAKGVVQTSELVRSGDGERAFIFFRMYIQNDLNKLDSREE